MAQAFLHRQQDVGVAARLDMDHSVRRQAGQVEGRGEQVAPAQAPEYRAVDPREDAGQEDRRGGIVAKLGAAGDLVQRAGGEASTRSEPSSASIPNGTDAWRWPTPSMAAMRERSWAMTAG